MTSLRATTFILLCVLCVAIESAVLISDIGMHRMIELNSRRPFCKSHVDRGDIQRMLLAADQRRVRYVPLDVVEALERECKEAGGLQPEIQGGLAFIYPGTKWCGPGSIAREYSDVGRYSAEDRCCREHDLCPNVLLPGECKRGLCNQQQFTRSHCDCDAKFRRCLQGLNTETANTLGAVFFNVVQVTCFKERRPCSVHQRDGCPYQFHQSHLYISQPILSILKAAQLKSAFIFGGINFEMESRSLENKKSFQQQQQQQPNHSLNADSTKNNTNYFSAELQNTIRFASLSLAAQNIFHDLIVRRVASFLRLIKITTIIWDN